MPATATCSITAAKTFSPTSLGHALVCCTPQPCVLPATMPIPSPSTTQCMLRDLFSDTCHQVVPATGSLRTHTHQLLARTHPTPAAQFKRFTHLRSVSHRLPFHGPTAAVVNVFPTLPAVHTCAGAPFPCRCLTLPLLRLLLLLLPPPSLRPLSQASAEEGGGSSSRSSHSSGREGSSRTKSHHLPC